MAGLNKQTSIYQGNNAGRARSQKSEMDILISPFYMNSAVVIHRDTRARCACRTCEIWPQIVGDRPQTVHTMIN